MVRTRLECTIKANCPYLRKDIYYLERIQQAAKGWIAILNTKQVRERFFCDVFKWTGSTMGHKKTHFWVLDRAYKAKLKKDALPRNLSFLRYYFAVQKAELSRSISHG